MDEQPEQQAEQPVLSVDEAWGVIVRVCRSYRGTYEEHAGIDQALQVLSAELTSAQTKNGSRTQRRAAAKK